MKTLSAPLITDNQSLVSASMHEGRVKIPVYDDGYGPLFIHRDSMGISGIVRAQTWEDAYSICEDEFFQAATETHEELEKEFSTQYLSGRELWLYEHGNDWNAWQALPEYEKRSAIRAGGKDVPFLADFTDHPCFQEQYGFRNNSRKEADGSLSTMYAKDLNGDYLDTLTPALLEELGITLEIKEEE